VFRTFDSDNSGKIDFKEFLLAINITSAGKPEQKLEWAFQMYDVNGDGTIEPKEMTEIIAVSIRSSLNRRSYSLSVLSTGYYDCILLERTELPSSILNCRLFPRTLLLNSSKLLFHKSGTVIKYAVRFLHFCCYVFAFCRISVCHSQPDDQIPNR